MLGVRDDQEARRREHVHAASVRDAGVFLDTVTLTSTGTHTIYIDPAGTNTGSVTVTAYDVPVDLSGSISIAGAEVPISLINPAQNGRLAFEGAAGQVVKLTMKQVTIAGSPCCSAWVSIETPGGATLGARQLFGTVGGSLVRTLTTSGVHSVFIDPVNANTGGVTLALSIAGGSPVDGATVRTFTPSLRVDPAPSPTDYYFEIATDSTFTTLVDASGALPTTNTYRVTAGALRNETTYSWRYKTTGGPWINAGSFTTAKKTFGARNDWPMWSYGPLAVNKVTGNIVVSLPGPSYPTAVGSMSASLTYNSLDSRDQGLGPGWKLNGVAEHGAVPTRLTDLHVVPDSEKMDAAEVLYADGDAAFFHHVGQTNTYVAEPGDGRLLSRNPDATWTLIDTDGSIYSFDQANGASGIAALKAVEVVDASPGKGKLTYEFSADGKKIKKVTDGADRSLTFNWHSLNASACTNAILCVVGPDTVTWRYIGAASGGTAGNLVRVNNGIRDVAAVDYDIVGRLYKFRNANDLDPSAASPSYNPDHLIEIGHFANSKPMWVKDSYITLADGGSQGQTTWFDYYPGGVETTPTRAVHGTLPAGTIRIAAGYTTVKPPRQHGAQDPKGHQELLRRLGARDRDGRHPRQQEDG